MTNFIVNTEDRKSSIKEIYGSVGDGDIILNPEYQRNYVYDVKRASKVIESVLLEIPLPAIFANEEKDGSMEIIDGVQRITSIIKFINNDYALTGLEILSDLNGKTFQDFTQEQKRNFRQKTLRIIKFKKDCSEDLKFEIFLRLNQGSVKLNNQELRNCMYRGYFNNKLKEIALNPLVLELLDFNETKANRFAVEEYILRAITFMNYDSLINKKGLNANMNEMMRMFKNDDKVVDKITKEYIDTLSIIKTTLGINAFKNNLSSDGKFVSYYYDSMLIAFKNLSKASVIKNKDVIKSTIKKSIKSEKFLENTKANSSNYAYVLARANFLKKEIEQYVIELDKKRYFSQSDKQDLFNKNNTCAICGNIIESINDANVDHIIPWSKGGTTTLDNAQLTHEFCNKSKGNRE